MNSFKSKNAPSYYFCDFLSKNDNLGIEKKILNFLGIQSNHSSIKRKFFVMNIYFELYKVILALFGLILVLSVLFG